MRSQCSADSFLPPVSGYERPSARWTVPPIFSSKRIVPIGRSMPKFVPMPSSPRRRAPSSVAARAGGSRRRARRARRRPRRRGTPARRPATWTPAGRGRDVEAHDPVRARLVRAGEDLAAGHVALAVAVDPRAALDVQRQVGAVGLDADLARAFQALDERRLERAQLAPRARPGRAGRGTARARRTPRSRRATCRPPARAPRSARPSSTSACFSVSSRSGERARARAGAGARGRCPPARACSPAPGCRATRAAFLRLLVGERRVPVEVARRARGGRARRSGRAARRAAAATRRARGSRAGTRAAAARRASSSARRPAGRAGPRGSSRASRPGERGAASRLTLTRASPRRARRAARRRRRRAARRAPDEPLLRLAPAPTPMTPIRHSWPASGPRPPVISMPCSSSSALRTAASSTPSGGETASSGCSCSPSGARRSQPSTRQRVAQRVVRLAVALPARLAAPPRRPRSAAPRAARRSC